MEAAFHQPVMLEEALGLLAPERGGVFVDCTVGLGGHAEALLERADEVQVVAIDRDPQALLEARKQLQRFAGRVRWVHASFDSVAEILRSLAIDRVAGVLADLGVSSMQLERAERGFSLRREGPLDMRMNPGEGPTAAEIVNQASEAELQRILREYGEERRARRIAQALVRARSQSPILTTTQLREQVHRAIGSRTSGSARHRVGGIDSATRTFQALRIEVNRELAGLRDMVDQSIEMLDVGGRLVVISYHSLEDRIVKTALREATVGEIDPITGRRRAETRLIELLTKKPLRPGAEEIAANPRSRSARLRAGKRI